MNPVAHWIRAELRWAIYVRDGFTCVWCGRTVADAYVGELTLDHVFNVGHRCRDNHPRRLLTACVTCNSGRRGSGLAASLRQRPEAFWRVVRARAGVVDRNAGRVAYRLAKERLLAPLPEIEHVDGGVVDSAGIPY